MKRVAAAVTAVIAALAVAAGLFAYFQPVRPDSAYETAGLLLGAPGETLWVIGEAGGDQDAVFRALEAGVPAPFALRCATYPDLPVQVTRFTLERRGKAAQAQAELLADGLAHEATEGMTDPLEKLRALHDLVVYTCAYDERTARGRDELDGFSAPFTAYGVLAEGKAVCAGYARAYMLLAQAVGLDVIYITSNEMDHGWNAVRLDGQTYFIDCTFDDPVPDMGQYALHDFCLVTAETLRRTHTWDETFYEGLLDTLEKN